MAMQESILHLDCSINYPDVVVEVGKVTFGEKSRNQMRDGNLKRKQTGNISQAACALLNSGGGVIKAEVENVDYDYKKHGIGQDIEKALTELIPSQTFLKYFDFEYIQKNKYVLIFVKSWSCDNSSSPRICSLRTGLCRRSFTRTETMSPTEAAQFLKEKADFARRQCDEESEPRAKKALLSDVRQEQNIYVSAERFYTRDILTLGEKLNFTESTHVEFKNFATKNVLKYVKEILPTYISAFANTQGGFLFIGVDDSGRVVGCRRDRVIIDELKEAVEHVQGKLSIAHFCTSQHRIKLECKTMEVFDEHESLYGYVCAVRIQPFCCVVFSNTPDSWAVKDKKITRMAAEEWTDLMMATDPVISDLCQTFTAELSVSRSPPLTKTVFSIKGLKCLRDLPQALFSVNCEGIVYNPDSLCRELFSEYPGLEELMKEEMEAQQCSQGLLIFARSWAVSIGLPESPHVVCDALLIAAGKYPTLYTVKKKDCSEMMFDYSRLIAHTLKQKLVNDGGYTQRMCVIPQLLELGSNRQDSNDLHVEVKYPLTYVLSPENRPDLLQSLVIILLSFRSFLSDRLKCEFFNLLTIKQYEILTKNLHKSKKLFIYGLLGTGKTVVALNIIERIKNVFHCGSDEILYICENQPLKTIVQGRNICESVTRVAFLKGIYPSVKHIVIDEAQNFRSEDGDWYAKAKCITQGSIHREPGVLWIFLDYLQTSHPFPCGLPDPSEQYPQEWLTVGVRNATQIYDTMLREMQTIVRNPQIAIPSDRLSMLLDEATCGHPLPGLCTEEKNLEKEEIATYVADACSRYFRNGYSGKDIAILCNTVNEVKWYRHLLQLKMRRCRLDACFTGADGVLENAIVLDSVRRFSGLERNIVFGINPVPLPKQAEISSNLKLCAASRANLQLYLLYER
ncbi:schlafen family member 13-like isoform X5 [Carettochelys insculpta]